MNCNVLYVGKYIQDLPFTVALLLVHSVQYYGLFLEQSHIQTTSNDLAQQSFQPPLNLFGTISSACSKVLKAMYQVH